MDDIEQLKKWVDNKLKRGYKLEDLKEVLKKKYDAKTLQLVFKKETDVEWLKKFRSTQKKKEEVKKYTNLVSYALVSLLLGIALWYSAAQFSAIEGLDLLGLDIINQMRTGLWVGSVLGFLFFAGFVIALFFKKYNIYHKYIKK